MQTEGWKSYVTVECSHAPPPLTEWVLVLSFCSRVVKWMKTLSSPTLLTKVTWQGEAQKAKNATCLWDLGILFHGLQGGVTSEVYETPESV